MAEVKVKITAANETQTGFQSVLADAQKTAAQVQQTFARASQAGPMRQPSVFTPDPSKIGPIDIGDYGLGPLRELQEQLRNARKNSQAAFDVAPVEKFGGGIGGVVARFALLIGGAATVGKVIASAFDRLSEVVRGAIANQEQFNSALEGAGNATSVESAIAGFRQLNKIADETGKMIEQAMGRNIGEALANALSGRPGQLMARFGDALTGGAVSSEINAQEEQQRRISQDTLRGNFAMQIGQAEDIVAAGGDQDQIKSIEREYEKRKQLMELQAAMDKSGASPQYRADMESELKTLQNLEDQIDANVRLAKAKAASAAAKDQSESVNMSPEQRLTKEKAAMEELVAEQEKYADAAALQPADSTGGLTEAAARYYEIQTQIEASKERQARLEELLKREAERNTEAEKRKAEAAAEAEKRKTERRQDFNQNTDLMEARAAGDKKREEEILRQQDYEKAFEATNSVEDAMRYADAAAQLRAQSAGQQMTGSFGASSLQRIGFASNEYFDTRRKEDTGKQIERMVIEQKRTNQILGEGKTLVMQSDF